MCQLKLKKRDQAHHRDQSLKQATVEEGLAEFFSNPSHRATDPTLQHPIEVNEDWGDTTPVEIPNQSSIHNLDKLQGLKEDRDIFKEEEKGEDKIEEIEINIVTIVITYC